MFIEEYSPISSMLKMMGVIIDQETTTFINNSDYKRINRFEIRTSYTTEKVKTDRRRDHSY